MFIMESLSKDEKQSAAWTGKEEGDVDEPGSLTRFRRLCWGMLSMVLIPDLVENEGGRGKARDAGEGRRTVRVDG